MSDDLQKVYDWFYSPGEVVRSIGFYINPYDRFKDARFRHIFAFDATCNLYVGQFSVYQDHLDNIFGLKDIRERGLIFPKDSVVKPKKDFSDDIVYYDFLENKNITYLNIRLRKMAQRLFDYGVSENAIVIANHVDLWYPTIKSILKYKAMKKPDIEWLRQQLTKNSG